MKQIEMQYKTERTILELTNESLAKEVLDYYTRNREFLENFEPKRNSEFYTVENQLELIKSDMNLQKQDRTYRFWIRLKENDLIIGTVSISSIVRGAFQSAFLGYKLDYNYINKGIMTEVINEVVKIAFEVLNLHRIEANIMPKNEPSIHVVQKCGFNNEGISREYLLINGIWEDHYHFVKFNENWKI